MFQQSKRNTNNRQRRLAAGSPAMFVFWLFLRILNLKFLAQSGPGRPKLGNRSVLCGVLAAVLILASVQGGVALKTKQSDKRALLAVKDKLEDGGALDSWDPEGDPCVDQWQGVACNCSSVGLFTIGEIDFCQDYDPDLDVARVIFLDIGCNYLCGQNTGRLNGTVAEEIGDLDKLRFLDLSENNLTGTLPQSLTKLRQLRFLSVYGNQLTGELPQNIGKLKHLSHMRLDNNDFEGSIPEAWCEQKWNVTQVDMFNNERLCGEIPKCLFDLTTGTDKIKNVENTFLKRGGIDVGGVCDKTPPVCKLEAGCLVKAPPFWTSLTQIEFYFHDFSDPESRITDYYFTVSLSDTQLDDGETHVIVAMKKIEPGENIKMTRTRIKHTQTGVLQNRHDVMYNLTGISLNPGSSYNVTVSALNGAGPPLMANATSTPVRVDSTGPDGGTNVLQTRVPRDENSEEEGVGDSSFGVSWEPFSDNESNVSKVIVQVYEVDQATKEKTALAPPLVVPTDKNETGIAAQLMPQKFYQYEVRAENNAGLSTTRNSPAFFYNEQPTDAPEQTVEQTPLTTTTIVIIVVLAVAVGFAGMVFAVVTFVKRHARMAPEKNYHQKAMRSLMYGLLDMSEDQPRHQPEKLKDHKDIAFVVTDLENSTAQSNYSEVAFRRMLDIHNQIMREGLAKHGGYEIQTEGDSFQVAFTSVVDAVLFCMETQYRLLEVKWPQDVLKLPGCRTERALSGDIMFKGPRVRMGIHWAREGTTVRKLHDLTRHLVFAGPGFELAKELGDAAHGGQVLMTHDAWLKLQPQMGISGFPTVEQIGLFKMKEWVMPVWLYQVTQLVGRPLRRTFPPPRILEDMEKGWGFNIVPPPVISKGVLTFVAVRMTYAPNVENRMPDEMAELLYEVLASQAQQFKGYMYIAEKTTGRYLLTFSHTLDAVRFCHASQVALLHTKWPEEGEELSGPTITGPDSRAIFHGPRVAIAVHFTKDFVAKPVGQGLPDQGQWVTYDGMGEKFVKRLAEIVHGGQVVLSETAWAIVQDRIPQQTQSISLGKHKVDDKFPSMLLMEVLPSVLGRREFGELETASKLEPGYRDAPSEMEDVAIVFIKAGKPKAVKEAEGQGHNRQCQIIADYNEAVYKYIRLVRDRLPLYNGYECKETELGKITLAFRQLEDAIRWAAHVQLELMTLDWPEGLLELDECRPIFDPVSNTETWRGLRVKMGMAYGRPHSREPLNTGRADYFGTLPNLAARVSALATPGQILVNSVQGFGDKVKWMQEGSAGLVMFDTPLTAERDGVEEQAIEMQQLGFYLLKGIEESKLIYQARPLSLLGRQFDMDPAAIRVADPSSTSSSLRGDSYKLRQSSFMKFSEGWGAIWRMVSEIPAIKKKGRRGGRIRTSGRENSSIGVSAQHLISITCPSSTVGGEVRSRSVSPALSGSRDFAVCLRPLKIPNASAGPSFTRDGRGRGESIVEYSQASGCWTHTTNSPGNSWGESVHGRTGSMVSVTSRGPSSLWRSQYDVSPSSYSTHSLDPGCARSLSLRNQFPALDPSALNVDTPLSVEIDELERERSESGSVGDFESTHANELDDSLPRRGSDASALSGSRPPRIFAQELAELYAEMCRRHAGSMTASDNFAFPVVDDTQSSPRKSPLPMDPDSEMTSDLENPLPPSPLAIERPKSCPGILMHSIWSDDLSPDARLARACSVRFARRHSRQASHNRGGRSLRFLEGEELEEG